MQMIRRPHMPQRPESHQFKRGLQQLIPTLRPAIGPDIHSMYKTISLGIMQRPPVAAESHVVIIFRHSGGICNR